MEKNELLLKYLGDMDSVESHIYQAIDKQVKETADQPDINALLSKYRDTLDDHRTTLDARIEALGGSTTHKVKELGASILGVGAGLVNAIRDEGVSKMLRDDNTAINLSIVSYLMLHTTAVALGDNETAELAKTNVTDNAEFVMEIQRVLPQWVVNDLQDDFPDLDSSAVGATQDAISEIWGDARQNKGE